MGWTEGAKSRSYPDIECLDTIAACRTKSDYFGPRVGDAYLKVAVRILLVEHNPKSFVHVYDKAARVLTGDIYTRISIKFPEGLRRCPKEDSSQAIRR